MIPDLRTWQEDPAPVVEWLLGAKWYKTPDGYELTHALPFGKKPYALALANQRDAADAINTASLALLRSRSVWRTPMGFDLILGRWPTDGELNQHGGKWRLGASERACSANMLRLLRKSNTPPTFAYPLRPDGLPGVICK